jgi:hypothetical protein
MTRWTVLLEFRHDVPAFEVVVEAAAKADAIRIAEEAAVAAGYADAELRTITTWPLINWIKKEVA